ncbi:uncharacterized protein BDV14DRAFT_197344 [Aspergillus stella-maris]|uniref:uncharacterized protein n=1 Tax=Aspergillus stella-maris TaxID=1810926 RepID=UPI003CCD4865
MPDKRKLHIEDLPDEIWLNILCQMIGTNPDTDPYAYMFDSVPSELCLVNRRWNSFYTPFLYATVSFIYHLKQTKHIWLFLRTIVARPNLAQQVCQLALFNRGPELIKDKTRPRFGIEPSLTSLHEYGTFAYRKAFLTGLQDLYRDNEDWLETAYQQAGWNESTKTRPWQSVIAVEKSGEPRRYSTLAQEAKNTLLDSFESCITELSEREKSRYAVYLTGSEWHYLEEYHKPLMALIVAHCPSVHRLHMNATEDDGFLDDILCWASYGASHPACPKALCFQNVDELSIEPTTTSCINIGIDRPYYRLPKLRTFVAGSASVSFGRKRRIPIEYNSCIQNLCLKVNRPGFDWSNLLGVMTNLRQLSICLGIDWARDDSNDDNAANNASDFNNEIDNDAVVDGEEYDTGKTITQSDLWNCLLQFKDQLEYLDIYQEESKKTYASEKKWFCPPLREFTKLRHLSITPRLLLGHECEHFPPRKFRNHLPPNILSIFLYTNSHLQGLQPCGNGLDLLYGRVRQCATELEGIAIQGAQNGLRVIGIGAEDTGMVAPFILTKLREATARYGIQFIDNLHPYAFTGGRTAPLARATNRTISLDVLRSSVRGSRMGEVIPWPLKVFHVKGRLGAPVEGQAV